MTINPAVGITPNVPASSGPTPVVVTNTPLPVNAFQTGIWNVGFSAGASVTVTNSGTFPVQAAQTGTWNITNITGTISLPTGAATSALQTTINTTLGSPFQAGGSIGNTGFNVTGTLPAFASTPTFNLGTLNGAATFAEQQVINTSVQAINTTLGTPFQAGGSIGNTTFAVTNTGTFATQLTGATNNINNISGTITLPTGAAKDSSLSTINTTLGSPFQAGGSIGNTSFAATQSGPWNITNITGTISLPTNAAQETGGNLAALLTTENAINAKVPALGAAATAASTPVNIASDQVIPVGGNNFDTLIMLMAQLVTEMRMLRQSFQDWTAQPDPRIDLTNDLVPTRTTLLQ